MFHVSELHVAEDIMNIYEDIITTKAKNLNINPNISANINYDYNQDAFFVHLRSDIAITEQEYIYFEYVIEYVWLSQNHNLVSTQDFENVLMDIRYRKRGMFEAKPKNIFKGLSIDELELNQILEIVSFLNNEDFLESGIPFQVKKINNKSDKHIQEDDSSDNDNIESESNKNN